MNASLFLSSSSFFFFLGWGVSYIFKHQCGRNPVQRTGGLLCLYTVKPLYNQTPVLLIVTLKLHHKHLQNKARN